jgi:hypothetical protein
MFKRKIVAIVIASLASLVLVGLGFAQVTKRPMGVRSVAQAGDKPLPQGRAHIHEEATPIQEGVMTAKQKRHSKIFQKYEDVTGGKKIRDLIIQKGATSVEREVGDVIVPSSFNSQKYLQNLSCKADAVVVGTVTSKSSQITDDKTFLFTDYELAVEDILKNNAAAPIPTNSTITITRTGGSVNLNGHIGLAVDDSQKPLLANGRYLLFLKFIPETGAYRAFNNWGDDSFAFRNDKVAQVSESPLPFGPQRKVDAASFMTEVRTALSNSCNQSGGGQP